MTVAWEFPTRTTLLRGDAEARAVADARGVFDAAGAAPSGVVAAGVGGSAFADVGAVAVAFVDGSVALDDVATESGAAVAAVAPGAVVAAVPERPRERLLAAAGTERAFDEPGVAEAVGVLAGVAGCGVDTAVGDVVGSLDAVALAAAG